MIHLWKNILWKYKIWWASIIIPFVVFFLLLFRNPYSNRTLIGNFEPFPDSFHYVVPAREIAEGKGFFIARDFGKIVPSVPPLYSLFLAPTWLINDDARSFYVVNVVLALSSFAAIAWLLRLHTKNPFLLGSVLLLWVTNWYMYWLPSLAMSENLLLLWIIAMLLWVRLPLNKWSSFIAGLLIWLPYFTKFSAAPQTVVFGVVVLLRYWSEWKKEEAAQKAQWLKQFGVFILTTVFVLFISTVHEFAQSGTTLFHRFFEVVTSVARSNPDLPANGESFVAFSASFFLKHFPGYLQAAFGKVTPFLWDRTPVWEWWIAWFGIAGLFVASKWGKRRGVYLSALSVIFAQILFMATFYVVDARYILPILVVVPLGVVGFIETVNKRPWSYLLKGLFVLLCLVSLSLRVPILRKTVAINLKYAETPWYMISVQELDMALATQPQDKPIAVISALAPHLHDFYSNRKVQYHLLPLARFQDFRTQTTREQLYGQDDYSDLMALYNTYLEKGYDLYIESYGLGNVQSHHEDYQRIMSQYETEKIWSGCHGLCDVYKIQRSQKYAEEDTGQ